jgi:hypothetical protein
VLDDKLAKRMMKLHLVFKVRQYNFIRDSTKMKQVVKLLELKKGNSFEKRIAYEEGGEKYNLKLTVTLDNPNEKNLGRSEIVNIIITNINPAFKVKKEDHVVEEVK